MHCSTDWHPADIKAALAKKGYTLKAFAAKHNYERSGISRALIYPWPNIEALVAEAIGVPAPEIWPSRYDDTGKPIAGKVGRKNTSRTAGRAHVQKRRAA